VSTPHFLISSTTKAAALRCQGGVLIGLFSVQRRLEYGKYNFLIYLAHNEYAQYLPARLRSAEKIIMKA
jgi:hypothetical protein